MLSAICKDFDFDFDDADEDEYDPLLGVWYVVMHNIFNCKFNMYST